MKKKISYICDSCGTEFEKPSPAKEGCITEAKIVYHYCKNSCISTIMPKEDESGICLCSECTAKLKDFMKKSLNII